MATMAKEKHWLVESNFVRDDLNFQNYMSSLTCPQITKRAAIVGTTTIVGAGIGGVVGSAAGGIGAIPAAIRGGHIGFGVGMALVGSYDYSEFKKYRSSLTEQARVALDDVLKEYVDNPDDLCAILMTLPIVPVRINGEKQVYEKSALEEALDTTGISPMTRKPFTRDDIKISLEGFALSGKICDAILNNPQERAKFNDEQIKGIKILRKDCADMAKTFYEKETAKLTKMLQNGQLTPMQHARRSLQLANVIDPIMVEQPKVLDDGEERKI